MLIPEVRRIPFLVFLSVVVVKVCDRCGGCSDTCVYRELGWVGMVASVVGYRYRGSSLASSQDESEQKQWVELGNNRLQTRGSRRGIVVVVVCYIIPSRW